MKVLRSLLFATLLGGCAEFKIDEEYRQDIFIESQQFYDNFQDPVTGREYRIGYIVGIKYNGKKAIEICLRPLDNKGPILIRGVDNDFDLVFEMVDIEPLDTEKYEINEMGKLISRAAEYARSTR